MTTRRIKTGTPEVLASVSDHVATITLNRPEKRNALSESLTPALRAALDAAESDPDVRVIVLTGAEGAFCAGGDVSGMGDKLGGGTPPSTDDMIRRLQVGQEAVSLRLHDAPNPPSPPCPARRRARACPSRWPVTCASPPPAPRWYPLLAASGCRAIMAAAGSCRA